jgi:ATP-dependent protease HslVU (ClpYQ) peptidase subunit
MSVVVAVTKNHSTILAADSLTLFGSSQRMPAANSSTTKVRRIGSALLGATGWGIYDNILDNFLVEHPPPTFGSESEIFAFFLELWRALHDRYSFVNDQCHDKDSPFGDLDSTFLIGTGEGIFKVSHDMDVARFKQYYAIGSGSEYALGAMHQLYDQSLDAAEIARRAVRTAIEFDVNCGGEVTEHALTPMPEVTPSA